MIKNSNLKVFMIATTVGAMVLSSCVKDEFSQTHEQVLEESHAEDLANYKSAFVSLVGQPSANQCWDFTKGGGLTSMRSASENNSLNPWPSHEAYTYGLNDKYITGKDDPLPEKKLNELFKDDLKAIEKAIEDAANAKDFKTWPPTGTYLFRTFATVKSSDDKDDKDHKYFSIGGNFSGKNNFLAQEGVKKNPNNAAKRGTTGNNHTACIKFDKVPEGTVWFAVGTKKKDEKFKANDHKLTQYVDVTVNGYRYWGFKCEKGGSYKDFILIVKEAKVEISLDIRKRYMVEDLGGSKESGSDIDFNDIVFDVEQYSDGSQKCVVRALGGTLPIRIKVGDSDWWSKPAPTNKMINTGADGKAIDFGYVIAEFPVSGWKEAENNIQVEVQDKNDYKFITEFPTDGTIPLIVAFSGAKNWNAERVPVSTEWFTAYPEINNDDEEE